MLHLVVHSGCHLLAELGNQTHVPRKTLRAILRGLFCCPILAKGLLFSIEQFWTHAHLDRFSSSNNGLLLPECDTDSTGLHCTSSRSDHAQNSFQMTKEVALTRLDILVDSILGHASLLTFCKLKILVEYFYTHCRPRWDATVLKVKDNPHRHNLFICLFIWFDALCRSQQFFSHVGMIFGLPGSNQY